jgi:hypothetical protein
MANFYYDFNEFRDLIAPTANKLVNAANSESVRPLAASEYKELFGKTEQVGETKKISNNKK